MANHLATSIDHSWRDLLHVERVSSSFLDVALLGKHVNGPTRRKSRVTRPSSYFGGILNNRNDPLLHGQRRKALHEHSYTEIDSGLMSRSWYQDVKTVRRRSQVSSRTELSERAGKPLRLLGQKKPQERRASQKRGTRNNSSDVCIEFLVESSVLMRSSDKSARRRTQVSRQSSQPLFCNEEIRKSVELEEESSQLPVKTVKARIVIPSFLSS